MRGMKQEMYEYIRQNENRKLKEEEDVKKGLSEEKMDMKAVVNRVLQLEDEISHLLAKKFTLVAEKEEMALKSRQLQEAYEELRKQKDLQIEDLVREMDGLWMENELASLEELEFYFKLEEEIKVKLLEKEKLIRKKQRLGILKMIIGRNDLELQRLNAQKQNEENETAAPIFPSYKRRIYRMSSSSNSVVTQEEFNQFHSMDRKLYTILVLNIGRDPLESMQIMALWIWLERVGFKDAVHRILSLPHSLISGLAAEAVTCLNCINNEQFSLSSPEVINNNTIPLIQHMKKEISLQFFVENRAVAQQGVSKALREVCNRALSDLMHEAVNRKVFTGVGPWRMNENVVPADDRTLFVTFSKGYPVYEWEVQDFFTRLYGACIEAIHMQEVELNEQPLFARVVFHSPSTIGLILNGASVKAKFTINGKHIWARKFVPKRPKATHNATYNLPDSIDVNWGEV